MLEISLIKLLNYYSRPLIDSRLIENPSFESIYYIYLHIYMAF